MAVNFFVAFKVLVTMLIYIYIYIQSLLLTLLTFRKKNPGYISADIEKEKSFRPAVGNNMFNEAL